MGEVREGVTDLAARLERLEREHEQIAEAIQELDKALGAALEMLKAHHGIISRSVKRATGNGPAGKQVLN